MNIVVTGGSGFLGKHLCHALKQAGHVVKNIDLRPNEDVETVIGDVQDRAILDQHLSGQDAVFHLASNIEVEDSFKRPAYYIQNNVLGTLAVLEAMRAHGVKKFLFSSSAAVYGEPIRTPIVEDDRTLPINPYGVTKLAMEGLVSSYVRAYEFTGVALRYFNLYGPGENHDPETHAIPRFIKQILHDEEMTVWGNGKNTRDFIYIEDIVAAHLRALELPQGYHYINLSGKNATEVGAVIALLEKITGKTAHVKNYPARPGDPAELFADATKAKTVLSWEAQVGLEEGLKKTVEWFQAQRSTS